MRRIPVVPTLVVALAVAAMVALGFWQLDRRQEKEALLAQLAANERLPTVAFPRSAVGDDLLFRRASADCTAPGVWRSLGGRDARGRPGWRQIARCPNNVVVQIGVAATPDAHPTWRGGPVTGYISHAPDATPLIVAAFSHAPKPLMLVADPPQAGLAANPAPDLSSVPNNHFAYAVQWFLFAGLAVVIYALALRSRSRKLSPSPRP